MQSEGRLSTSLVILGVAVLIALGVIGRIVPHWPNFTPVVAIAVFAAYVFRTGPLAWIVPVAVMAISNAIIGGYEWGVMASVYAALLLAVAIGRVSFARGGSAPGSQSGAGFAVSVASLASAVAFFLITNFAVWAFGVDGAAYPQTWAGLLACYTAALPWFKFMLAGTAFWAMVLFGGHYLAGRLLTRRGVASGAS